jgi:hypothetical protein
MVQERVKRWPVGFAEQGERLFTRFRRFALSGLKNERPMRRLKRGTTLLQGPWNRFHELEVSGLFLWLTIQV